MDILVPPNTERLSDMDFSFGWLLERGHCLTSNLVILFRLLSSLSNHYIHTERQ